MTTKSVKIAVSLPKETYDSVEDLRQELGLGRSAVILAAVRLWLQQKERRELEDRYAEGYKRKPERAAEVKPFYRAGLSSFSREEW